MATDTTSPFRTQGESWTKLEPAMLDPEPKTKHTRFQASRTYGKGQLVGQTAAAGVSASVAHGALANARLFPLVYPIATDANGYATLGDAVKADDTKNESMEVYIVGWFYARDLVGLTEATLPRVGSLVQGSVTSDASNVFSDDAIVELG